MNSRLSNISTPSYFSRNPRAWEATWKAVEYKNFVLYFFEPLMADLMPQKYYDHFLLFVRACRRLSSTMLTKDDFTDCQELLCRFVSQTQELYGKENMDFCVHSMLHLCFYAQMVGPLYTTSCFQYESMMKTIRENLHGVKDFDKQFIRVLKSYKYVSQTEMTLVNQDLPLETKKLFKRFNSSLGFSGDREDILWKRLPHSHQDTLDAAQVCGITMNPDVSFQAFNKLTSSDFVITSKNSKAKRQDCSWVAYSPDGSSGTSLKYGRVLKIMAVKTPSGNKYAIQANVVKQKNEKFGWREVTEENRPFWLTHDLLAAVLIPLQLEQKTFVTYNVKYFSVN